MRNNIDFGFYSKTEIEFVSCELKMC